MFLNTLYLVTVPVKYHVCICYIVLVIYRHIANTIVIRPSKRRYGDVRPSVSGHLQRLCNLKH